MMPPSSISCDSPLLAQNKGDIVSNRNIIKCVLVGDGQIGKTSMVVSYSTERFCEDYVPTVFDKYNVVVMVDNQPVSVQLCDTAGQDDLDPLRTLCYPDTDVFLVCFSVVNPNSFKNVRRKWVPELRRHWPEAPMVLVGTQGDRKSDVRLINELAAATMSNLNASARLILLDGENPQFHKSMWEQKPVYVYNDLPALDAWPSIGFATDCFDIVAIVKHADNYFLGMRGTARNLIVVTPAEEMIRYPMVLWKNYRAFHFAVFFASEDDDSVFFTWNLYSNCTGEPVIQILDECVGGQLDKRNELYPNKIPALLENCPLTIGFYHAPTKANARQGKNQGPQDLFITAITDKLKVKVNNSRIWRGDNVLGVGERLLTRVDDIQYSTMVMEWQNYLQASFTPSYLQGEFRIVVPTPKSDTFSSLYSGFSISTWSLIATFVILMIFFVALTNFFADEEILQTFNVNDVVRASLAHGVLGRPKHFISFQTVVVIFIIYSLLVTWFYQSTCLSNLFRGSFEKPINVEC